MAYKYHKIKFGTRNKKVQEIILYSWLIIVWSMILHEQKLALGDRYIKPLIAGGCSDISSSVGLHVFSIRPMLKLLLLHFKSFKYVFLINWLNNLNCNKYCAWIHS